MHISVVTLFPEMVATVCGTSILGRAQTAGALQLHTSQLRDFAHDKHRTVDEAPAGGGAGMVLKVDVVVPAVRAAIAAVDVVAAKTRVLFLDAHGPVFAQPTARALAVGVDHLVLVCGRYEGFDARCFTARYDKDGVDVTTALCSIGDLVLTGGELSALVVLDAVVRLLPGVLGNDDSAVLESHSVDGLLEHRHYTRPVQFDGVSIPSVLSSGNHALIDKARAKDALLQTRLLRPDLFVRRPRNKASTKLLVDDRIPSLEPPRSS